MVKLHQKVMVITFLSIVASLTQAALIDNDTYTSDTFSGLDWLDVPISQGDSYDYVSQQFGYGETYDGWRYATGDELLGLVHSAGGTEVVDFSKTIVHENAFEYGPMDLIIEYLGLTIADSYELEGIYGMWLDPASLSPHWAVLASYDDNPLQNVNTEDDYIAILSSVKIKPYQFEFAHGGSFLVRDTDRQTPDAMIPEPASFSLLCLGLLGLTFIRRNR